MGSYIFHEHRRDYWDTLHHKCIRGGNLALALYIQADKSMPEFHLLCDIESLVHKETECTDFPMVLVVALKYR